MITVTVEAPRTGMAEAASSVRLEEGAGKLNGAVVQVANPAMWESFLEQPLVVSVHRGAMSKQFHGYLDTIVPNIKDDSRAGHLVLLGLTKPMRSGRARSWTNLLPSQIASDILNPHAVGLEMDNYELRLPFFAQKAGKSDWETLVALADECGMIVHTQGATVRLVHPEAEIRRNMLVPKETFVLGQGSSLSMITSDTPIGWEHRKLFGTDKFGKDFSIDVNPGAAVSLEHSERLSFLGDALAAAERLNKRNVLRRRAILTTSAVMSVKAGDCIATVDKGVTTNWLVVDAEHNVQGGNIANTFSLCRPASFERMNPAARRTINPRPEVVLANGRWRAQTHHRATL